MANKKEHSKTSRKRVAAGAAAVTTAAVLVGGLFSSPADLLADSAPVTPVTAQANPDAGAGNAADEEEQRRGLRARARQWVRSLPVGVRALVGVPLWGLGWVILSALSLLWTGLLSPVAGRIAGWLCLAAVLLAALALTGKAAFPDVPLKKFLNRRSFLGVLIGVAVLALADQLLPLVWEDYPKLADVARACGALLLEAGLVWGLIRRERKRRRAQKPSLADRQEAALRRVREMADSARSR